MLADLFIFWGGGWTVLFWGAWCVFFAGAEIFFVAEGAETLTGGGEGAACFITGVVWTGNLTIKLN